ncbi:MAG: hypothetical protein ACUZ8E_11875 [Candidatus Anammoxibacter sp.]
MHGFVNVFAAVLLGIEHKLDGDTLSRIIEDEDHANFQFNDESLCWNDLEITVDRIIEGRNNAIISFGCCSFDEPRDDLRKFGLLSGRSPNDLLFSPFGTFEKRVLQGSNYMIFILY